jgi:hypothetical protein
MCGAPLQSSVECLSEPGYRFARLLFAPWKRQSDHAGAVAMSNSGSADHKWHLTYPADQQTVLAIYVLENLEAVKDIVGRARVRLQQETGDGSFDAYTTGQPQRVRDQCRAIYEEVRALGLTYSVEAPGSVPYVQVVRLADEVLRDKCGCCLDLALLLAGALLRVGIFPLLTVVGPAAGPDHIVLGYWLKERTQRKGEVSKPVLTQKEWRKHRDEMAFVESTDVAAGQAKPFADAEKGAQTYFPPLSVNKVWYVVDVRACRVTGIKPLAVTKSAWVIAKKIVAAVAAAVFVAGLAILFGPSFQSVSNVASAGPSASDNKGRPAGDVAKTSEPASTDASLTPASGFPEKRSDSPFQGRDGNGDVGESARPVSSSGGDPVESTGSAQATSGPNGSVSESPPGGPREPVERPSTDNSTTPPGDTQVLVAAYVRIERELLAHQMILNKICSAQNSRRASVFAQEAPNLSTSGWDAYIAYVQSNKIDRSPADDLKTYYDAVSCLQVKGSSLNWDFCRKQGPAFTEQAATWACRPPGILGAWKGAFADLAALRRAD